MKFYTVLEIAKMLSISDETVYRHINSGKLKASKIGQQWRISEEQLQDYLKGE